MANRFWVGGTASWDATAGTKWALTSGGAGGQAVPTSSDDVFFDSGSGAVTVTIAATSNCNNLDCTGFTGTLTGSSNLNIFGNMTIVTGMTYSASGTWTFSATTTGKTITFGAPSVPGSQPIYVFNGVGGGWQLQDSNPASNSAITLIAGSLDINGKTLTGGNFTLNGSTTRALTLGTGTIKFSTAWNATTTTNLTFSASSGTLNSITCQTFHGGGLTYGTVTIGINGNLLTMDGANTFGALTINAGSGANMGWTISANQTVSGTLTIGPKKTYVYTDARGTGRTITCNGTVAVSGVTLFRDITGAGSASWDLSALTSVGDSGGNSGITFPVARTLYWHADTGNYTSATQWFTATNGGGSLVAAGPMPQDTGVFDGNSFTATGKTVTIQNVSSGVFPTNSPQIGKLDFSTATNNPTLAFGSATLNQGYILVSGMTCTGTPNVNGLGNGTITTNGVSIVGVAVDCLTGSITFSDALTYTGTITATSGTTNFSTTVSGVTLTIAGGTLVPTTTTTLSGAFSVTSGTLSASGLTITGGTTASFSGGTSTIGTLSLSSTFTQTAGTLTIGSGGVSCTTAAITGSTARTLHMGSGTWTLSGTGTIWDATAITNLTFDAGTSTISLTNTSATTKTFTGNTLTYNNISVSGAASNGTVTFSGAFTANVLTFAADCSIIWTKSTTYTFSSLVCNGSSGHVVTWATNTSGTFATHSCANPVDVDWMSIKDSHATGSTPFYAGNNSTNVSGNNNWTFTTRPVGGVNSNFFMLM